MQIEVGKQYLTRDGRVVHIHCQDTDGCYEFSGYLCGERHWWDYRGRFDSEEHHFDLVAEVSGQSLLTEALESLKALQKALAALAAQLEKSK